MRKKIVVYRHIRNDTNEVFYIGIGKTEKRAYSIHSRNKAAAKWTIEATNTGQGWHPPTGKHVEVIGISILHFADGKIKDEWIASNNLYWLQQLGYKLESPFTGNSQ